MKNLLIALMVFGMCAMCGDVGEWVGKPVDDLVRVYGEEAYETYKKNMYWCSGYMVTVVYDSKGVITGILLSETSRKNP